MYSHLQEIGETVLFPRENILAVFLRFGTFIKVTFRLILNSNIFKNNAT